jgi:hypothetical protein
MPLHQDTKRVPVAGEHLCHHGCIGYLHSNTLDWIWGKRLGKALIPSAARNFYDLKLFFDPDSFPSHKQRGERLVWRENVLALGLDEAAYDLRCR